MTILFKWLGLQLFAEGGDGGGKIVIDFAGDADIEKFLTRFADK